jgi:chloramphenicol O-acetyltransferase type A
VPYSPHFEDFILRAEDIMDKMSREPSLEDEEGRDDFLFLSSFPWVSFTGFQHAMHFHPADSVPRFAWGKYFEENGKIKMPLSVQAHHALVDGIHTGRFFEKIGELFANMRSEGLEE